MPHQALVDPLAAYMAGALDADRHPVPLVSTRFDVTLTAALATVAATRIFRNAEAGSIEATITLPVPVHAQVFGLAARVGGRWLTGRAKARAAARAAYEDAVDRGKPAVLHEEALRGVHVLSVAHIAPGAEIEVRVQWVETLRLAGDRLKLRIPTTVGEVYGRSPLSDADGLLTGGEARVAEINVRAEGPVWLGEALVGGGRATAPLNRPIDLAVPSTLPRSLIGQAAEGGPVRLAFSAPVGEAALDLAILVDRSGSMDSASAASGRRSKHQAVREGLAAARLAARDRVRLWQFDTRAERVGEASGRSLGRLVRRLGAPQGGTEIGGAIETVLDTDLEGDVLVITDGLSHALDVQALARRGRRITVLLVGENSLEARIGHLAALTGGEIFVAADHDIPAVIATALAALRRAPAGPADPGSIAARRGGLVLEAVWDGVEAAPTPEDPGLARAVGALVASLRLPMLNEAAAAKLAEAEGLVSHLTSLVLVDEASAAQESLPVLRKVALPEPAVAALSPVFSAMDAFDGPFDEDLESPSFLRRLAGPPEVSAKIPPRRSDAGPTESEEPLFSSPRYSADSVHIGQRHGGWLSLFGGRSGREAPVPARLEAIDWGEHGTALAAGDLSRLPSDAAEALRSLAGTAFAAEWALRLRLTPLVFAILATAVVAESRGDRAAGRVARRLLRGRRRRDLPSVEALVRQLAGV